MQTLNGKHSSCLSLTLFSALTAAPTQNLLNCFRIQGLALVNVHVLKLTYETFCFHLFHWLRTIISPFFIFRMKSIKRLMTGISGQICFCLIECLIKCPAACLRLWTSSFSIISSSLRHQFWTFLLRLCGCCVMPGAQCAVYQPWVSFIAFTVFFSLPISFWCVEGNRILARNDWRFPLKNAAECSKERWFL